MPMGPYKDFADCVRKNRDKRDPQAYCASIMRQTEGKGNESAEAKETPPKATEHTGFWKGHL